MYSVAHPLRLDYTGLKKRLGGVCHRRRKARKPAFVELMAPPSAMLGECLIEFESLRLTQSRAAHILGIDQPKISRLLRGQLSGFSTERLIHFLTLLGRDVEITDKPAPRSRRQGHLRVVATA